LILNYPQRTGTGGSFIQGNFKDGTRRFFESQRTAQYWLIPHRYKPKCACPLSLMCLFVCMSSNATAEAMADDTDSHPTVLLQEYSTARAIPVRTGLLVQDASIVRLIRSVMCDPAFLCFWYVFVFLFAMSMAVDCFVCICNDGKYSQWL